MHLFSCSSAMASLAHNPPTDQETSSSQSFTLMSSTSQMDMASHPAIRSANATTIPCFPNALLQEFEGHPSFGKFHQDMPPAWQQQQPPPHGANVGMHLLSAEKHMKNPISSFGFADGRMLPGLILEANPAAGSLQNFKSSPELMGSPVSGGTWKVGLEQKLAYSSSNMAASMLPTSNNPLANPVNVSSHGLSEGSSSKELVGRLGSTLCSSKRVSSFVSSSPSPSAMPLGQEIEKMLNLGSGWSSMNTASNLSLAVDPSKGALAIHGVNLSASHCLANFSSDPGFAERAAKFSCFGSEGFSELGPPFSLIDGEKTYPRSMVRHFDKPIMNKLTRNSSFPPARSSALSSPSSVPATEVLQDPSATLECFSGAVSQEPTVGIEHGKFPSRIPRSPARIEVTEATQKLGTSVNESDEADASLGQEESSSSGQGIFERGSQGRKENLGKKRKSGSKEKPSKEALRATAISTGKDASKNVEMDEAKGKRYRSLENEKEKEKEEQKLMKAEQSNSANSGDSTPKSKESPKPPEATEPPKPDYIHVRARRGQATDSHSLAERVRREKISERMKYLQDLVPGCSKVTGKAVMLDEIINYVQSLQRQVEFLSMKLAAVNPRLDFNIDSFINKEIIQPRVLAPSMLFVSENTNPYPPPLHQQPPAQLQAAPVSCGLDVHPLGTPADSALRRTIPTPLAATDASGDAVSQQISQAWDDELQSVVQMGFGQNRLISPSSQGRLPTRHMKVEL